MAITEDQYGDIADKLDSDDFYHMGNLVWTASNSNLPRELDDLHTLSKQALDYRYDNKTHANLAIKAPVLTGSHHPANAR